MSDFMVKPPYVLKNSLEVKEKMVENWDRWKWLNDNHTISIYVSNVSMDWFKGKFAGSHRFSMIFHDFPIKYGGFL